MIIVKCDNCKKIVTWQEVQDREYNYRTLSSRDMLDDTHLCLKCRINLSEKYHEKYESLKERYETTVKQLSKVKKELDRVIYYHSK